MKKLLPVIALIIICSCSSQPQPGPTSQAAADMAYPDPVSESNEESDNTGIDWNDRSVYKAGLIASQQDILSELPGAPVYHINFTIEKDLFHLTGDQAVHYTNQEEVPLNEVKFHLYPNLLGGSLTVSNVLVNDKAVSPSYELSNSLMVVPLSHPLEPGENIIIQFNFDETVATEIETNYGMFASFDGVLALAHFFPILAVYDESGWYAEIPPKQGDLTYADASFYKVQVTAPKKLVLAASGVEVARKKEGNNQVITFAAGPVRDFYLAASKDYDLQSKTVGEVTFNSYAPKEMRDGAELAIQSAENAYWNFSKRYAPYPYTEFDIVTISTYAYGIEYPGITAIGFHIYDLSTDINGVPVSVFLESTIAHEFGHQYFYNQVGSNQLEEPWLDESLTQYVTWMYYKDLYGANGASGFGGSLEERWNRVEMEKIPIGLPVAAYVDKEYGAIVYGRGAFFFEKLALLMGQGNYDEFIKDYVSTYSWENATGEDFKALGEQYCNCDLTSLFKEWVYPQE